MTVGFMIVKNKNTHSTHTGGDVCLYDDPVAKRVQEEKRVRAQALAERQAAATAAAAAATVAAAAAEKK
jgi:hypothetical protein